MSRVCPPPTGRVRQALREDGIGVLLISNVSNLTCLAGYDSVLPSGYAVGVLPDEGEIELHCSTCEAVCALERKATPTSLKCRVHTIDTTPRRCAASPSG